MGILVVHPGSRIRILDFLPIPDLGSRGQKGTGSRISDPGVKKAPDLGSGTLAVTCKRVDEEV
jgi:hypothetical protein